MSSTPSSSPRVITERSPSPVLSATAPRWRTSRGHRPRDGLAHSCAWTSTAMRCRCGGHSPPTCIGPPSRHRVSPAPRWRPSCPSTGGCKTGRAFMSTPPRRGTATTRRGWRGRRRTGSHRTGAMDTECRGALGGGAGPNQRYSDAPEGPTIVIGEPGEHTRHRVWSTADALLHIVDPAAVAGGEVQVMGAADEAERDLRRAIDLADRHGLGVAGGSRVSTSVWPPAVHPGFPSTSWSPLPGEARRRSSLTTVSRS